MWEIVSFGDVITLNQIFNAISVIFSDAGYKAASVAILLFVTIGMTIHNFIGGAKELPFGQILAGILLFGMGFTTLTSVSIENRYDGTVTQIDNVPIAIAVPASLVSSVGLWITTKTETAFANTGMQKITTDGYLSPLKVIANLRRATYSDSCPSGLANSTSVYNLCYSLRSYMADCAMIKSTRDNHSLQMQKGDILTEMQFNSNAYSTQLVKADGTTEDISCSSAYTKIKNDLNTQQVNMMNALGGHIGLRTGEDGIDRVKQALKAIAADSSKATNFAHSIYLANPSEWGTVDYLQKIGASDLAENYTSSIQQRNYEWALQAEMWVKIVDKFLSLFEAILYAVAPFIGLMVLTGSVGMKTLLLYVQMLLVIQFIPPMLVIVQNITLSDMAVYQKTLIGQGMVIGSLDYMQALTKKANELMGLGGMLATSVVPAMAMALVSGSGMAMMGAIRSAAAPPKDTDAVPQVTDQGGVTNLGKMSNGDMNFRGDVWAQDATQGVINLASSTELQGVKESKFEAMQQTQKTYQETSSNAWQAIHTQNSGVEQVARYGQTVASNVTNGDKYINNTATALEDGYSFSEQGAKTIAGVIAASANAGVGAAGAITMFTGVQGGIGAKGELSDSFKETLSIDDQKALKELITSGEISELSSQFSDLKDATVGQGISVKTGDSYVDSQLKEKDRAYQEAEAAKQAYATSDKILSSVKMANDDIESQYHILGQNEGSVRRADEIRLSLDERQQQKYAALYNDWKESGGTFLDDNTAKIAALSAVLKDEGREADFYSILESSGEYSHTPNAEISPTNTLRHTNTTQLDDKNIPTNQPINNVMDSEIVGTFGGIYEDKVNLEHSKSAEKVQDEAGTLQDMNSLSFEEARVELANQNPQESSQAHLIKDALDSINEQAMSIMNSTMPISNNVASPYDEKIAELRSIQGSLERTASDYYLGSDHRAEYSAKSEEIGRHIENLEAMKVNAENTEIKTLSLDEAKYHTHQHQEQLKAKLENLENQRTNLGNSSFTSNYTLNQAGSSLQKEIDFINGQLDNIKNGEQYKLNNNPNSNSYLPIN